MRHAHWALAIREAPHCCLLYCSAHWQFGINPWVQYQLIHCIKNTAVLGSVYYHPSLGAAVGDFLDKPIAKGGLDLSRYSASAALLFVIVACILFFP